MPEDYMHKHLQPLVGMRVTNIVLDQDKGEYALRLESAEIPVSRAVCYAWIMCDEEGNGPGHLDLDWEKT